MKNFAKPLAEMSKQELRDVITTSFRDTIKSGEMSKEEIHNYIQREKAGLERTFRIFAMMGENNTAAGPLYAIFGLICLEEEIKKLEKAESN